MKNHETQCNYRNGDGHGGAWLADMDADRSGQSQDSGGEDTGAANAAGR